jgi:hypothetical protein
MDFRGTPGFVVKKPDNSTNWAVGGIINRSTQGISHM